MGEVSNTVLFSHLLRETAVEIDELGDQIEEETSLFFADKRVSLMEDFLDDLKLYVHAFGIAGTITDLGKEIYARILSQEQGKTVSIDEASKILDDEIARKKKINNSSWTALPKAVYKSMDDGDIKVTQDLFNRWYLLMGFISRDAIDAFDVAGIATNNLDTIAESIFKVCKKREGYFTEHVVEVEEADTSGEMIKTENISFIPEIYEPDIDDLYISIRNQYEGIIDLWPGINPANDAHRIPALGKINALVGHEDLKRIANDLSDIHQSGIGELKGEFLNVSESAMTQSGHHTVLMGNPGTGKTTAARLLGQLHYDVGNLSKGHVVEVSAKDLISNVIGGTAPKTGEKISEAIGGVLFIDEAYKLYEFGKRHNFASQSVTALIAAMENEPDLVVVFAGYNDGSMEDLLKSNSGLPRRIRHTITCEDFSVSQLMDVLGTQLQQRGQTITDAGRVLFEKNIGQSKKMTDPQFWGNAGFVRDYLSNVISQQELRVSISKAVTDFQKTGKSKNLPRTLRTITVDDVRKAKLPVMDFLKPDGLKQAVGFKLGK